jgi:aerobic C4-dicarboxylate transport protein
MRILKSLYGWIIIAFVCGCCLGFFNPALGLKMEPLSVNFIKIIKIFIGPIVFLTIILGIAQSNSLKKLGKIGIKTLIYFEIMSTLALITGWVIADLIQPGAGVHANLTTLDPEPVKLLLKQAQDMSVLSFMQSIVPTNIIEPFYTNNMLQILILAILFGVAMLATNDKESEVLMGVMQKIMHSLFHIIKIVMYLAPIGVFGSMSFTIAKFGGSFLLPLMKLVLTFYISSMIFVMVFLGSVARMAGFSILKFLRYIGPELLLVLTTSSSESALPQLLEKLERIGCKKDTVGIVVPMGYSFNLDGTNIYITLAALFIAQALGIDLTFTQEVTIFLTAMLSSKGAAGITGAGFITLAATLAIVPSIPIIGIVLIFGVDRFMSEARAVTNFIGNGVASLVISRLENELSKHELQNM